MLFPGAWCIAKGIKQTLHKYDRVSGEKQAKQLWGSQDKKVALLTGSTKSRERRVCHCSLIKGQEASECAYTQSSQAWVARFPDRSEAREALNNVKCETKF